MAKFLIDNAFPLTQPFDQYIYTMVSKNKLKEYVASPLLGCDLSSSMYINFYTKDDLEYKKYIKNESNNIKIIKN